MQPDLISLQLDPDETRPHQALPPRRLPPPQPAIFGIMHRVGLWLAWLTVSFGAYSALVKYRWTWHPYFLATMLITGYMATKKDSMALETSMLTLGAVWIVLLS